jgi:uncharacterized membrane protein (DUF2068 family)
MAARASGGVITLAVINIVVALMPVCAGCIGGIAALDDQPPPILINGRDMGPQFKQHIDRQVPHAKYEAFTAAAGNMCFSLLLLGGAVGLFMAQNWARWLSVGTAVFLILVLCVHDIYQLAIFRPAVDQFFDVNLRGMRPEEKMGFKIGFSATYFFWACFNPILIIYLAVMALCLSMSNSFSGGDYDDRPRKRRSRPRDYDDEDDDRPRRRRSYDDDDDEDDRRTVKRRRRYDDDD